MTKKSIRDYEPFWLALKNGDLNPKYSAKVITLKIPESHLYRVRRSICKEKDIDWQFKNDNVFNPWFLKFKVIERMAGSLPGHGVIILRVTLDRKTDV